MFSFQIKVSHLHIGPKWLTYVVFFAPNYFHVAYGTQRVCRYSTRVLGRLMRQSFDSPTVCFWSSVGGKNLRYRQVHNLDHDNTHTPPQTTP
jgi:hypothetical protein